MQQSPDQSAHDEVTTAFHAYLQATLDGDTDAPDDLLADGCTLTHLTGYVQPKDEWLSDTLTPKRGEQLAELPRAQPGKRGYPGGLRRRDHTSHAKIISLPEVTLQSSRPFLHGKP